MANGHGGYRKPEHPAPVSGPGKYSKRTDGQVLSAAPNQAYGEATAQMNEQRVAPMGAQQPLPTPTPATPTGGAEAGQAAPQLPAFQGGDFAGPTQRPNEPITTGIDSGPGAGSEALSLPQPPNPAQGTGQLTQMLTQLSATDTTGILATLAQAAAARNA